MKYSALKGIQDILPPDIYIWQKIESIAKEIFHKYGFKEIRLPIIESTDIFIRSIGETTDIVEKEMYTFADKAGRSITMRPEGTAPAVRCYVEHHLYTLPSPQKFFYSGPMFRYERPQKGRFRQFYQVGVEAFGVSHPSMDAEIIAMLKNLLEGIGLKELHFELNSIGCDKCRPAYRNALLIFFRDKLSDFCPDCQRRYKINPLRILDCKVERCIELRQRTPLVTDYLCSECREHFEELIFRLQTLKIPYTLNPNLVRGLDYYTRTAFEVTSEHLGAQKAVAAGGRYDKLVEEFGGPQTPAIGFAIGMERIATLLKEKWTGECPAPKVFIATLGKEAEVEGFRIAEDIRAAGFWVELNHGGASLKSQLRKADRIGAELAFIIGENELKDKKVQWKNLKKSEQGEVEIKDILSILT
ncbi:histidine--tRNA ligase [Dissulfurispira thermophila]|uniref:Histidine--tRNA ligase n=1 Tax=Dissulfurispira thermophila TaxID=2715679 RepID=A0A7G1H3K0_9BACT|nr:histidine--tRNA ligase [Dissulfurispira thermophila]BCB97384.1 histidine--tRNA ligase [Dissulfurispira thermophila]